MPEPHNRARGEVILEIDAHPVRLCLTLGALAELEAAFDVISLAELAERLAHLTAADIIVVLAALTKGGGDAISATDLATARIDPRSAAAAVADAFRLALDA
ncbi:MAG: GTA-gp10 family protein [Hyphomonadaceae bacterium]